MATASAAFKSREDHRKQLELEEARKAGLAPAELDEDGKEINPHIPQYMSSAPWYLNAERPVRFIPCIGSSVFVIFGSQIWFCGELGCVRISFLLGFGGHE